MRWLSFILMLVQSVTQPHVFHTYAQPHILHAAPESSEKPQSAPLRPRMPRRVLRPLLFRHSHSSWLKLADCESGQRTRSGRVISGTARWHLNKFHDGGLQFHPGTWRSYKRPGDPSFAWMASPVTQIAVAKLVRSAQGWGAWPLCSRKLGLRPAR
jgi:hypothetical protein